MVSQAFCVLLAVLAGAGDLPAPGPRLNLLVITADDLNADSQGWVGAGAGATPSLDAFAATCVGFERHHVTVPICQPSRAVLMTGRLPHRSGALGFDPVRRDVPTLVEVLKHRGYFTAAINKIEHMKPDDKFPWDLALNGSGKDPAALRSDFERGLLAAGAKHQPFFINANITDPHRPFPAPVDRPRDVAVPSFLEDLPAVRMEVARYLAAVARFDRSFSGLVDALKSAGHAEDTVIVFLSDHGMSFPFAKSTVYRNGTWSPVLFRWPGLKGPGVNRTDFVSSVDIMPTLLELLEVPPPAGMDGRSLVPLLRGETQPDRDHVVTYVNTVNGGADFAQRCVRTSGRSLIFQAWPDGRTAFRVEAMSGLTYGAMAEAAKSDPRIRSRVNQLVYGERLAFFDLENDPDERKNLIHDPRYRAEVRRLQEILTIHLLKTNDPQSVPFRKAVAAWGQRRNGAAMQVSRPSRGAGPRGVAPRDPRVDPRQAGRPS